MKNQFGQRTRRVSSAHCAGLLVTALLAFSPNTAASSSVDASSSAVQSVTQSTRDELERESRSQAMVKCEKGSRVVQDTRPRWLESIFGWISPHAC
jgi:hypothetical protein